MQMYRTKFGREEFDKLVAPIADLTPFEEDDEEEEEEYRDPSVFVFGAPKKKRKAVGRQRTLDHYFDGNKKVIMINQSYFISTL